MAGRERGKEHFKGFFLASTSQLGSFFSLDDSKMLLNQKHVYPWHVRRVFLVDFCPATGLFHCPLLWHLKNVVAASTQAFDAAGYQFTRHVSLFRCDQDILCNVANEHKNTLAVMSVIC